MKFCNICDNILIISTKNDNLKYICQTCLKEYQASEEDTLMKNVSFKESESLYKSEIYLNVAHNDPLAPLIDKKCNKCDETIIKQILIGENYQGIFICPKCKSKFIE
jgi:DNA-directed RNA polymerase subunit M/transcription elongation factor TFIIS